MTAELSYRVGGSAMIGSHRLLPFLGIQTRCNLGRTDQITEEYRQMAPFAGPRLRTVFRSLDSLNRLSHCRTILRTGS